MAEWYALLVKYDDGPDALDSFQGRPIIFRPDDEGDLDALCGLLEMWGAVRFGEHPRMIPVQEVLTRITPVSVGSKPVAISARAFLQRALHGETTEKASAAVLREARRVLRKITQ